MTTKQQVRSLERKIERAIERGEFTPSYGYLAETAFIGKFGHLVEVEIGPCGCAMGAAGHVNGIKGPVWQDVLLVRLSRLGIRKRDALLLEAGYEAVGVSPTSSVNPYFLLGRRLRRFHPNSTGVE